MCCLLAAHYVFQNQKDYHFMAFKLSKTLSSAAATGLVLGAMTACGGSAPPAESAADTTPAAEAPAEASPAPDAAAPAGDGAAGPVATTDAKACCMGKNECKGKGGCKTADNGCAGKNACKGKGGCNMHCPK
jgi:hypothetical protein